MTVIGILLGFAGLGFLGWLLFSLAVYALPFFAGVTAGLLAVHTGAGLIGAIVVGIFAAVGTLVVGQMVFTSARSPLACVFVALAFAAPAAYAGYDVIHGLAVLTTPSEVWRRALAVAGALVIGAIAWIRVTAFRPAVPMPGVAGQAVVSQRVEPLASNG